MILACLISVSRLMEAVFEATQIPANKQVLLIANGEPLNPSSRVGSYKSAGTVCWFLHEFLHTLLHFIMQIHAIEFVLQQHFRSYFLSNASFTHFCDIPHLRCNIARLLLQYLFVSYVVHYHTFNI